MEYLKFLHWFTDKGKLIVLLLSFIVFISPSIVKADNEFASSYIVNYDVSESGDTKITENITLKNLTDTKYPSIFSLTISATQISDVKAYSSEGPLELDVKSLSNKTEINVKFREQLAGKGKEYKWTLEFQSKDFTQHQGKVWQVSIPRIASATNLEDYFLSLSIPVSFGDPTSILPEPSSQSESGGKINLKFKKDQITQSGILATFGIEQLFHFSVGYDITNNNILPSIIKLPLPPDTSYQEVLIESITPKPENVTFDEDGNKLAWFKVDKNQFLKITIEGLAKIYYTPKNKMLNIDQKQKNIYTTTQKYWENDSPIFKTKLAELLSGVNGTNTDKARVINSFVVNTLKYNNSRIGNNDFQRLGALTALYNSDNALCSEFTDLFIAFARATDIPARQLIGYAYTSNSSLRPLSFSKDLLHTWPEYFDPELGWVMIDPTWQNTTGGVDYFSKFDLNHLVLGIRGASSTEPIAPDTAKVEFSDSAYNKELKVTLKVDAPEQIFAIYPAKLKVIIENLGNTSEGINALSISATNLQIAGKTSIATSAIPPYGHLEYEVGLNASKPWDSYEDVLQISFAGQKINKKVVVKPFFELKTIPFLLVGAILTMGLIYVLALILHARSKKHRVGIQNYKPGKSKK